MSFNFPSVDEHGRTRTPYAVTCGGWGFNCGLVYLTKQEYIHQLSQPDFLWKCPVCGCTSTWSDRNYDEMTQHDPEPPKAA